MGASLQGDLKIVTYDDKGEEGSEILKNWVTYRESLQIADLHSAVLAIVQFGLCIKLAKTTQCELLDDEQPTF